MKKLIITAVAAVAPAIALASPALAATTPTTHTSCETIPDNHTAGASTAPSTTPPATGAPQTAADTPTGPTSSPEEDRVAILKVLADPYSGQYLREAAQHALDGTAADMRHFLETTQYIARYNDDRIRTAQIISVGGLAVRKAGDLALISDDPEKIRYFLEVGQYEARNEDNRVRVSQIINGGGSIVKEAGKAALRGTPQDVQRFLDIGQYEARFQDDRIRIARILSGPVGPTLREAGEAALDSDDPDTVRNFLDVGQYQARAVDEAHAHAHHAKPAPTHHDSSGKHAKHSPHQRTGKHAKPTLDF
ncbi:ALF repeat-containing protein [Streptantibioticus rubrisoli]|uniref:ALF repeat-containing protein n=1 Tax=Streptantibioticus rubrisoli TaxID=1387313 RepID=A0ABT1PFC9_9ACTN|nr:ALF repeat-containing protein [Streptantibioticus rubrisoli]MCQ4044081.1 ALF repeat-containing protein [Streptantibioticus rubrisoli]